MKQWRIELFGGLRTTKGAHVITRFRTQKTGALMAYLAYYLDRAHPREALFELLWPECLPEAGRDRLSTELSSLRHQFEPPGVPRGTIIVADRTSVRLNADAVTTDVALFERDLQAAQRAKGSTERIHLLADAVERYGGPLLPNCYENWILPEQQRLAELFFRALHELTTHLERSGEISRALEHARRGVRVDPLREESHCQLMRLYAAAGQPAAALRQYHELQQILKQYFGDEPDAQPTAAARKL